MSLKSLVFAIPGDLAALTGGYGYDRQLIAAMQAQGIDLHTVRLGDGFPNPSAAEVGDVVVQTRLAMALAPDACLLMDGLAYCALPVEAIARLPRPLVALVHHPLGLEAGLLPEVAAHLIGLEKAALALCDHIIVTSATTSDTLMADFAVKRDKITVAEPGTDCAPRSIGSGRTNTEGPRLLAAGSVVPRKGYEVLVAAMGCLKPLAWHLDITGSLTRAPQTVGALQKQITDLGLGHKITLCGEYPAGTLAAQYNLADIFVMSSHYEGYGMVIAEAMAHGLAIVSTDGGALARTLPEGAGIKVPAGNVSALAGALAQVIADVDLRSKLAAAAWLAGQKLPRWPQVGSRVLAALEGITQ